jgi:hypothetical protein
MKQTIENLKGCKIATITYTSVVKLPKKYGIVGVVEKVVTKQVQLNYSYENAVNNRLAKQGTQADFQSQTLPWGAWVVGQENKLIEHKGELYLRAYSVNTTTKSVTTYFVDNQVATTEQQKTIALYEQSKAQQVGTQSAVGLQVNQVRPMNIKLSNILELKVDGQTIRNNQKQAC